MKVGPGMLADRAFFRRFFTINHMPAVGAMPGGRPGPGEDLAAFDIGQEFSVPLLVVLFDLPHQAEQGGDVVEPLLLGLFGEPGIHVGPLEIFPVRRILQIPGGLGHGPFVEQLEPDFGMFFFIDRGLLEKVGDLLIPVLAGPGGVIGIFDPGLAFTGESLLKVFLSLGAFQVFGHVRNPSLGLKLELQGQRLKAALACRYAFL